MSWALCVCDAYHRIDSLPYEHRMLQFMAIQSVILPMKCNEKTNNQINRKRNPPTAFRRANSSTLNAIEAYVCTQETIKYLANEQFDRPKVMVAWNERRK